MNPTVPAYVFHPGGPVLAANVLVDLTPLFKQVEPQIREWENKIHSGTDGERKIATLATRIHFLFDNPKTKLTQVRYESISEPFRLYLYRRPLTRERNFVCIAISCLVKIKNLDCENNPGKKIHDFFQSSGIQLASTDIKKLGKLVNDIKTNDIHYLTKQFETYEPKSRNSKRGYCPPTPSYSPLFPNGPPSADSPQLPSLEGEASSQCLEDVEMTDAGPVALFPGDRKKMFSPIGKLDSVG